jgi:hypothetical protein
MFEGAVNRGAEALRHPKAKVVELSLYPWLTGQ